ncbi:MAG: hypothetical protein R2823_02940 [Acidimicrobiia bacterium]
MSRRLVTVAATLVSMIAAGALAFWIATTLTSETALPPAALPEFGEYELVVVPTPVFGDHPWEAGLELAAIDDASRTAASELGVVLEQGDMVAQPVVPAHDGSPGSASAGSGTPPDPTDPAAPGDPAGGPVDEPDGGGIPMHPPGDTDPADTHMEDGCAEDPTPASCPEGVGGTVLAIRSLPDLVGLGVFQPSPPGAAPYNGYPECPPVSPTAGTVQLGITTNRPATTRVEYHPTSPHLLPPPPDGLTSWGAFHPDLPIESFEVMTPTAAEAPWVAWVEDEAAGYDDPRYWIHHCRQISDLAPGDYIARFIFTDKYDPTIVYTRSPMRFRVPDADGAVRVLRRRPVSLVGYGIDRLYVAATRKPDQVLQVAAYERDGTESCDTGGDPASLRLREEGRLDGRLIADDEIPRDVLTDPEYPYFREHSRSVLTQMHLTEGTDYLVCVYWLSVGGPSFEPVAVEEAEAAYVSTPEAYRPTIRLHGFVNLFGEVEGAQAAMWDLDCSGHYMAFEGRFESERRLDPSVVLCERSTQLTDWNLNGIPISTIANEVSRGSLERRNRLRVNLSCVTAPCPARSSEIALVPLPDVPTVRRLCGSGWGSGCDDEIPMRSAGNALIEISFDATPGNGATRWSIGNTEGFTDTPPPVPEDPRIDASSTASVVRDGTTGAPASAKLDVTVRADRPVTLSMDIVSDAEGGDACFVGLPSSYRADEPATTHSFTFHDLCLFESYRIVVNGADAAGRPTRLLDPATRDWTTNTFDALTPALRLEMVGTLEVTPPSDGFWHHLRMSPLSITPDLAGTDAPRRFLFPGSTEVDWLRLPGVQSEVGASGWSVFSRACGGVSWACGLPSAGPLSITNADDGIRPGIHVPYVGSTMNDVAIVVDINRGGAPDFGDPDIPCSAGASIKQVELRGTVSLQDLFAGVELTSESGSVRVTLRAIRWTAV